MNADALLWEVQDAPARADLEVVDTGLGSANEASAPLSAVRPLACFARADGGVVIGGAVGRTWGECCELQQFWVDPGHRRAGIGSKLVALFEQRARERGCRTFYLDTFCFQASSLYRRLGYQSVAEVAGFPGGIVKHLMVKRD
jgi:GNAT superfamily N-acetyltransferase